MARGNIPIGAVTPPAPADIGGYQGVNQLPLYGPGVGPGSGGGSVVSPVATKDLGGRAARTLTLPGQSTTRSVVYGHTQVGGSVLFRKVVNGLIYVAYGIAGHRISAYTKIMLGDYQLQLPTLGGDGNFGWGSFTFPTPSGSSDKYRLYLGAPGQALDSILHGLDSTWVYKYDGSETDSTGRAINPLAWFWTATPVTNDGKSPTPDPYRMTAEGDFALLLDHRADSSLAFANRAFSKNAALVCADAKLRFPLNAFKKESDWDLDEIDWASVDESADVCDQVMADGSKRYEMSGALRTPTQYPQIEDALRQHCMGGWVRNGGKWRLYIDRAQSWSGFRFTDGSDGSKANIRAGMDLGLVTKPSDSIPSQIEGQWTDPADGFKQKSVFVPPNADPSKRKTYNLTWLNGSALAVRVSTQIYNRGRLDKTIVLPVNEEGSRILPGMVIKGIVDGVLVDDLLLVTDVQRVQGLGWDLYCEWYDPAAYSDSVATQDTTSAVTLPDPSTAPPPPTACSATETPRPGPDGRLISTIDLGWTIPAWPYWSATRITVAIDGGAEIDVKLVPGSSYTFLGPAIGKVHVFRFYGVAFNGLQTDPSTFVGATSPATGTGEVTITPVFNGGVTIPDVTGLTAPNATDSDMGTCYWTLPTGAGSEYVNSTDVYVMHSGVWKFVQNLDLKSQPSSGSRLNLRPYLEGDASSGYSFGVKVVCKDKVGNASPGVSVNWFLPSSLAPITRIFFADAVGWVQSFNASWASAHSGSNLSLASDTVGVSQGTEHTSAYTINRLFARVPVTIPSTAILVAVYLGIVINAGRGDDDADSIDVLQGTQLNNPPATSDFGAFTGAAIGGATIAGAPAGGSLWWIPITDFTTIASGSLRFCVMSERDRANSAPPTLHTDEVFQFGVTQPVRLKIVYTDPGSMGGGGGAGGLQPLTVTSGACTGTTGSDGNPTFVLSSSPTKLLLFNNGTKQVQGVHYTLAGSTLTFLAPHIPFSGDTLDAFGV